MKCLVFRNLLYTDIATLGNTRHVKAKLEKGLHPLGTIDLLLRNRAHTGSDIRNQLKEVRQVTVSVKTVKRILNEGGLLSRKPAKVPHLETRHRVERLQFVKNYENCSDRVATDLENLENLELSENLMQPGNIREFYKVLRNLIVIYFKEISNNFFNISHFFQS